MQICPLCASENIFFSKKRNRYYCEDCESGFETPGHAKGTRIFLSYGHDGNAWVVNQIKAYLTGKGYDVWIDSSEIPAGKDWRERITNGLIGSNGVISFLSKHSVRDPGVCLDELKIAVCMKHAYVKTVLLEREEDVVPPGMVRNTQWIDMSDWSEIEQSGWDRYFGEKMTQLLNALNSDEVMRFNEELEFLAKELRVIDNTSKEQRLLKQSFVGRKWLTEAVYRWFSNSAQKSFVIYGVPGAGKSAFSANLSQFNPDVLAAVFFQWDHLALRTTDYVIRYLAFKIAVTLPDYRRMLVSILEREKEQKQMEQYSGASLFDMLILSPLQCCIDGNRERKMLVFDGIDETTPEIADLLISKATQMPEWIRVVFTSRWDAVTAPRFEADSRVMLDGDQAQNTLDLQEYFAFRLELDMESETVRRLAEKSEGSFMYAAAFCDAVDNRDLSVDDAYGIPRGLNSFYYTFFKRLFPTWEDFAQTRQFLELLCTDEDVPEEVVSQSLGLDRYSLWELRLNVKNLVTNSESDCGMAFRFKTVKLVHQSIKDWLTAPEKAGEFYIDVTAGYRRLSQWCRQMLREEEPKEDYATGAWMLNKLKGIDPQSFSEEDLKAFQTELEEQKKKNAKKDEWIAHQKALRGYGKGKRMKWLILGEEYPEAERILLESFDAAELDRTIKFTDYTYYYRYHSLWRWADMFPMSYPMDKLAAKFTELAIYPKKYIVSEFAHRSIQIVLLIMRDLMDSGRFRDAFYQLMYPLQLAGYFTSGASDDGETRDGWDKYYMARDAAVCLKKLEKAGVVVPENVRIHCEKMKLTYNCYHGDPFGGMFCGDGGGSWGYGILCEPELFQDICRLTPEQCQWGNAQTLLTHYNTTSLRYYLANSDGEDMVYIRECLAYGADLAAACEKAEADIVREVGGRPGNHAVIGNAPRRVAFIRALADTGIVG